MTPGTPPRSGPSSTSLARRAARTTSSSARRRPTTGAAVGRPRLDRRPARRHPRVRRARPPRLGGARGAVVGRRADRRGRRPAGARRGAGHRARPGRPRRLGRAGRGSRSAAPGPRPWPTSSRRPWTAELVPLGSAGYKTVAVVRGEVDAYVHARRHVPVGLRGAGRRGPGRRAHDLPAGRHSRWSTTNPIRGCLTWSSAARSSPNRSWLRCASAPIADTGRESAPNRCGCSS